MARPDPALIANQIALAQDNQTRAVRDARAIYQKGRHVARDGYPSSSMGGGSGGTEIRRPTEAKATAPPMHDPTGQDIRDFFGSLKNIYEESQRLEVLRSRIMKPEDSKGLRESTLTECKACERVVSGTDNDRIKGAGYCASCYAAFVRYRDNLPTTDAVDHAFFEKNRREFLEYKQDRVTT